MTQQEIIKYNKRCAEFLGHTFYDKQISFGRSENPEPTILPNFVLINKKEYQLPQLQFHSDWNWIMKVVEAIEKLNNFYVQIEESACYIYDILKFNDEQCNPSISCDLSLNSKKEAVVHAINQFLIWYNNEI